MIINFKIFISKQLHRNDSINTRLLTRIHFEITFRVFRYFKENVKNLVFNKKTE